VSPFKSGPGNRILNQGVSMKFSFDLELSTLFRRWAEQRRMMVGDTAESARERDLLADEYLAALQDMAEVVLRHHRDLSDASLVRAIRFLHDLPVETDDFERSFPEATRRFRAYRYREPGRDPAEEGYEDAVRSVAPAPSIDALRALRRQLGIDADGETIDGQLFALAEEAGFAHMTLREIREALR
jgi:aminoglycoside phosphotransferase